MTPGADIRRMRMAAALSVSDLARLVHRSGDRILDGESGRKPFTPPLVREIRRAIALHLQQFDAPAPRCRVHVTTTMVRVPAGAQVLRYKARPEDLWPRFRCPLEGCRCCEVIEKEH